MSEPYIKSSLAGKLPVSPWDDADLRRRAAQLYHDSGTVMIRPEWLKNEFDRQHMVNVAEKMYGKRS